MKSLDSAHHPRFAAQDKRNQLPVWVRSHVKTYDNFAKSEEELRAFFKQACSDPELKPKVKLDVQELVKERYTCVLL